MIVDEGTRYQYFNNYMIPLQELYFRRKTTDLSDEEIYKTYGIKIMVI